MFYVRLVLFSILLYNTEAWFDEDYKGPINYTYTDPGAVGATSYSKTTYPVTNSTSTNTTDTVKFINSTVAAEPKYGLEKTETNVTSNTTIPKEFVSKVITTKNANDGEESKPYPDWYVPTTTTQSNDSYTDRVTTVAYELPVGDDNTTKRYNGSDDYGYLTIENGFLTAHFPEPKNITDSEATGTTTSKSFDWSKHDYNTTRPQYPSKSIFANGTLTYNRTYPHVHHFTRTYSHVHHNPPPTRRPTHRPTHLPTHRPTWRPSNVYNTTNYTNPFFHFFNMSYNTTTSTKSPYWYNITTTKNETGAYWNRTSWYNRTRIIYRPTTTTSYPTIIDSIWPTSYPSFDQTTELPTNTVATSIYGALVDLLKKLARTISPNGVNIAPNGVNIAPNSNITNLAVANGNGNTIFYAYNYF